jgi:hypothetical protein
VLRSSFEAYVFNILVQFQFKKFDLVRSYQIVVHHGVKPATAYREMATRSSARLCTADCARYLAAAAVTWRSVLADSTAALRFLSAAAYV